MLETSKSMPANDSDVAKLDELLFDLGQRLQGGEPIDVADYKSRFPAVAEKLDGAFEALSWLAKWTCDEAKQIETVEPHGPRRELGVLGDYRLVRELGRGGMGVVYEAEQISLGRTVALKILPLAGMLDERQLTRFKNEARAAATLDHPHIVSVYAIGHEASVHFYAMQFVDGQSMAELIEEMSALSVPGSPPPGGDELPTDRRSNDSERQDQQDEVANSAALVDTKAAPTWGKLSTERSHHQHEYFRSVARLGAEAAEALEHAHANGIVHRDIKPGNLLIDQGGNLLVTDFGLARLESDAGMTMSGDLMGTLRYMSPEQAFARHGVVDHRADIYSLGATLYELATLQPMFAGTDRQKVLHQIATEEPPNPRKIDPAVPKDLETILLKSVRKTPEDRYATAQKFADDLRRFVDSKPIHAKPITPIDRAFKWSLRHRSLVAISTCAVALVALAGIVSSLLLSRAYLREAEALEAARENYQAGHDAVDGIVQQVVKEMSANPAFQQVGSRIISNEPLTFYKAILEAADESTRSSTDSAGAALSLGKLQKMLGKPVESRSALTLAERLFDKLHRAQPDDPEYLEGLIEANVQLGELLESTQEWMPAAAYYQKAIRLTQPWLGDSSIDVENRLEAVSVRVRFASLLRNTGNWRFAKESRRAALNELEYLQDAILQRPSDKEKARFFALRGAVRDDRLLAHNDLKKSIELDPTELQYRELLSKTLRELFESSKGARADMKKWSTELLELIRGVRKDFPWSTEWQARYINALMLHYQTLAAAGSHQASLEHLREARSQAEDLLQKQPEYREHHRLAAIAASYVGVALLERGDSHESIEALARASEKWTEYSESCPIDCGAIGNRLLADISLARAYSDLKDTERAEDSWANAEAAIEDLRKVGELAGIESGYTGHLAKGYWLLEQYERAIAAYEVAYKVAPEDAEVCNFYASSLLFGRPNDVGAAKKAERLAREAIRTRPGTSLFQTTLATAQYRCGEWEEALSTLDSLPATSNKHFLLAMCHYQLGNNRLSSIHYDRAIQLMRPNPPKLDLGGELRRLHLEAKGILSIDPDDSVDFSTPLQPADS